MQERGQDGALILRGAVGAGSRSARTGPGGTGRRVGRTIQDIAPIVKMVRIALAAHLRDVIGTSRSIGQLAFMVTAIKGCLGG